VSYSVTEYGQAFQEQTGIAFVQGIPAAVKAVNSLAFYGKKGGTQVRSPRSAQRNAAELDDLDTLLPRYSLTAPPSAMATTVEEVANEAARIGFPVAIKIVSPSLSHKTEAGGVVLGVVDAPGAKAAVAGLTERLEKHDPRAEITGFLSQRMVKGAEIIIGVRDDPYFGPFMVLGLGGIFVEVLKDVAVRLLPVSAQDVRDMLDELRSKPILHGVRGLPAADIEALIRSAVGLSNLFLDYRSVLSDIEVNPLIVGPAGDGAWAVDVRLVRRGGAIGQDHGRADE
jgi:acetyltransferase